MCVCFIFCLKGFIKMYTLIFCLESFWFDVFFSSLWIKENKSLLHKVYFWNWHCITTWKTLFFIEEKLKRIIRSWSHTKNVRLFYLFWTLPQDIEFDVRKQCTNILQPSQSFGTFLTFLCFSFSFELLCHGNNGIVTGLEHKMHSAASTAVRSVLLSLLLPSQMQWMGKMWAHLKMITV